MSLLEFQNITKSFGKKEVLKGISFTVKKGEIYGLIGVSGGGKSTLFNILMGLVREDKGKILLDGKRVSTKSHSLRKNTGFATQSNMIFDELTIRENAFYFGALYSVNKGVLKTRFKELLELLSLVGFEHTFVRDLSGGMKKRANLLISLIHNPDLLILDEPTVGLDPLLRESLWKYIHDVNEIGTTILVTSHLMDEMEANCHKIAILKDGRIVSIGTMDHQRIQKLLWQGSQVKKNF